MSIKITVKSPQDSTREPIKPVEVFGAEHGKVFRQLSNGLPQRNFLIGTGGSDVPISVWYHGESRQYRISGSCDKKSLKEYLPHIMYEEINAVVELHIEIK